MRLKLSTGDWLLTFARLFLSTFAILFSLNGLFPLVVLADTNVTESQAGSEVREVIEDAVRSTTAPLINPQTVGVPSPPTTVVIRRGIAQTTLYPKNNHLRIWFTDGDAPDGDTIKVNVYKEGSSTPSATMTITLSSTCTSYHFLGFGPGVSAIQVVAVSEGNVPGIPVIMEIEPTQVVSGSNYHSFNISSVVPLYSISAKFLQVSVSSSRYPESVRNVTTAWATKPRLLTFEKNVASARTRRRQSTAAYTRAGGQRRAGEDRDEYPPATFYENAGVAYVRSIPQSDNRGSGASFAAQLRGAAIGTGDVVEFVIGP